MQKKLDKISVIMPVFNAEKYIEKSLYSIENQTYKNLEVIIVNDGSTDNSLKICEKFSKSNSIFKVYDIKNGGPSKARNYGLDKATGTFCFFCDADDFIASNVIEQLYNNTINNKSNTLVGVNHCVVKDNIVINKSYRHKNYKIDNFCKSIFNNDIIGSIWGYLYSLEDAKKILFDENTRCMEDTIFLIKYLQKKNIEKIVFLNDCYYYYVNNSNSITNSNKCFELCSNYIYSLNILIDLLGEKYKDVIQNQIIRIFEYELGVCFSEENLLIFKQIKLPKKYRGNSIRYKVFIYLITHNINILIKMYYDTLNILKKIKNGGNNLKKIKIITINDNSNCGNRLQAYALNSYFNKKYNNVKTLWFISPKERLKSFIKYFLPFRKTTRIFNKFNKFNRNIKTEYVYDIRKIDDENNLLVVGSDQVWNSSFNSFNEKFLLTFSNKCSKYSYAASFGISQIPEKDKSIFKKELSKFDSISVRELNGKKIIESLDLECNVHIDPTMLIQKDEWSKISKKPRNLKSDKFIFMYFLGKVNDRYMDAIKKFSKDNECQIIDFFNSNMSLGPAEFLYLEKNAFLICTDSFHSSVFGIIFKRPFIIFERNSKDMLKMNSRIENLLDKFKIENRYFNGKEITRENIDVDYSDSEFVLEQERMKSNDYIDKIIMDARGDNNG